MRLLSLSLALLLSACASLSPPPAGPALPQFRVAPADFGAPLQLAQRLTVQEAPQDPLLPTTERQLDTVLQVDASRLRLVALALGQRVLTLGWDGQQLELQRHPLLPASVDAGRVLRDIALVFAPLDALRALLGDGWTLDEQGSERRLRHAGQVLLVVHYLQGRRLVEIDNRAERYRLLIESQAQDGQEGG